MVFWCTLLFVLGGAAFFDSRYNYGAVFREINAMVFLLVSLGIVMRSYSKSRSGNKEQLEARVKELEEELRTVRLEQTRSNSVTSEPAPSSL